MTNAERYEILDYIITSLRNDANRRSTAVLEKWAEYDVVARSEMLFDAAAQLRVVALLEGRRHRIFKAWEGETR